MGTARLGMAILSVPCEVSRGSPPRGWGRDGDHFLPLHTSLTSISPSVSLLLLLLLLLPPESSAVVAEPSAVAAGPYAAATTGLICSAAAAGCHHRTHLLLSHLLLMLLLPPEPAAVAVATSTRACCYYRHRGLLLLPPPEPAAAAAAAAKQPKPYALLLLPELFDVNWWGTGIPVGNGDGGQNLPPIKNLRGDPRPRHSRGWGPLPHPRPRGAPLTSLRTVP
ncbi:hypothetical protein SLEP1_g18330 [Rubroshorea leprosula]|uniref:Uncharacterized protein n=1 Tax=Rubroshorea leprosula TaxID=152421 RepID=A0AAV5J2X9_9ROSI|nr:hypothetical protein SLEP1_g18330 [Rubroshorea leprosula]